MSTLVSSAQMRAARRIFDVVVVGDGPASDVAASVSAHEGASVALVRERPSSSGRAPELPLARNKVALLSGFARFLSPVRLGVSDLEIEARSFVLAPDTVDQRPALVGLASERVSSADDLLSCRSLPERLLVVGAGPVGLELAQSCARRGSAVTLLDPYPTLLPESPALAPLLARALSSELDLRLGYRIRSIVTTTQEIAVEVVCDGSTKRIVVDRVAFALGRRPKVEHLALDRAGVQLFTGKPLLDRYRRTSNPRVLMAGDSSGSPGERAGERDSEIAGFNAAHPDAPRPSSDAPPRLLVLTEPRVALVGEPEARARARVGDLYAAGSHIASTAGAAAPAGLVRLWCDPHGVVLGGEALGEGCSILLPLLSHALTCHANLSSLLCIDAPPGDAVAHAIGSIAHALARETTRRGLGGATTGERTPRRRSASRLATRGRLVS